MPDYRQGDIGEVISLDDLGVDLFYIAGKSDQFCSFNLIVPLKFKDFKLPDPVETFSY